MNPPHLHLLLTVDVASALDYLHNLGHAQIVHCDLKPSNVLIDEEMIGHLGDFGLAKILLDKDDKQCASIGIKGTIGYVLQNMEWEVRLLLREMYTVTNSTT